MSLQIVAPTLRTEVLQSDSTENFIAAHFDRAYLMFNLFLDDPRACLDRSDAVFRALSAQGELNARSFYRELVQRIRALPLSAESLEGQEPDSLLCWLLKDSADLSYADIAAAMEMDREQVGWRIAQVRGALLA